MNNIRIDGKGIIGQGEYDTVVIDGMAQCDGDLKVENLKVDGKFKCRGRLTAGTISCDGMAEIEADLFAKKLLVDGMLNVRNGANLEAEEIICDGSLHAEGQISADRIEADGFVSAKEIVGDQITIHSHNSRLAKLLMKMSSQADLIEATRIQLRGVTAKTVNGCDVVIGPNCKIDRLDCSGTLSIDETAQVGVITGNGTQNA